MAENLGVQRTKLNKFLEFMVSKGGSDLHIKSGSQVRARFNGDIAKITKNIFTKEDGVELAKELLGRRYDEFLEAKSLDFNYTLNENFRFRVNIFLQIDGVSAVFRAIPIEIPNIDNIGIPKVIKKICEEKNKGIVLVTGPTGSGKTTTIASMIDYINHIKPAHIVTIEDPVEFVYKDAKSVINQRSLGDNCNTFLDSLRAALREDPDIIFVGEIRDTITMETAMRAAETGHLVLSTLHTVDAKDTINRILGMFEGTEQARIRQSFASVLEAIICQRLCKTTDGKRTPAVEIMIKNARIKEMLYSDREHEIEDAIKDGRNIYGMQTFDQHLFDMYYGGVISYEEALDNASNRADLEMAIRNAKDESNSMNPDDMIKLQDI
ncbi:MAG: PilT/PilU family type 4a pilus ATPase [Campylobacter sp.]|nr:PilT/PilU family type 4a pilus ATPase [Campylobacter sp.]